MEEGIEDETETVDEATPLTKTETDPIDNEKKSRPAMMGCPPLEWDRLTMAGALSTCAAVMIGANSVVRYTIGPHYTGPKVALFLGQC